MTADQWIVIPNWETFQHYKDRNPIWIKVYTELAHKPEWRALSDADRGVLITIWIEYALTRANVTRTHLERISNDDRTTDARRMFLRRSLDRLNRAGFIQFSASRPLARRYHDASLEEELLRNSSKSALAREPERAARASAQRQISAPLAPAPTTTGQAKTGAYRRAETMIRNVGWRYSLPSIREELARFHLGPDETARLEALWAELSRHGIVEDEDDW